ncbi:MAG: tetratricopeptide repeat protein [Candidatus Omnitrophota bacterium]|jgi:tetratricopeptide (TPR) repeat protein
MISKDTILRGNKWVIIFIVFFTALAYSNSLQNSFIWDDSTVIVNNDFVKSWNNFPRLFNRSYLTKVSDLDYLGKKDTGSGEFTYRPIGTFTYFLDYSFWKLNPFGYHFTNLILHMLNALLLFMFINLIVGNEVVAILASLFFALHPVNVEAVNCISFRKDLLAFLFYILAFIFYIKSRGEEAGRRALFYFSSLVSFCLALFSKEMSVTFPILLLGYDYLLNKRPKDVISHFKRYYLGYLGVLIFYIFIRFFVMASIDNPLITYPMRNLYTNILTMLRVLARYVQWMFFPVNIHSTLPDDPGLISYSLLNLKVIISVLLIISIVFTTFKLHKKLPLVAFGVFWFFACLIPVSNIIYPLSNYIAPRYLYLPAVGFCLILALLISKFSKNIAIAIIIFYAIFTFTGNFYYKNNIIFWMNMVDKYPTNSLPHSTLAAFYVERGLLDEAIKEYKIAVSLDKNYAEDHNELGKCYFNKRMTAEAIEEFKAALDLDPNFYRAWNNLASAVGQNGRYIDAIRYYEKAVELNKEYPEAYNGLGITYAKMNNYDEARKMWQKTLTIDPANQAALYSLKKLPK